MRRIYVVLAIVFLCFVARGIFYCSFTPMWEGYDEWAHFGYIQRLAITNRALIGREEPVSRELWASMNLAPAPWTAGKSFTTHDDFWRLSAAERAARASALQQIPPSWSTEPESNGTTIYEALQPPLYYWLASIPYRFTASAPLANRVFAIRLAGLLIASLTIPLVFAIARRVFGSDIVALFVAIFVALLPEFMVDVCRVSNECLGVVLFSWFTLEAIRSRTSIWMGVALGLGFLTKAYFLTALPALLLIFLTRARRAALSFGIAFAIAGWWYIRNRITTGTWSGLLESAKLVHHTPGQFFEAALRVNWRNALDSTLFSHIWFGGTSSLTVRSWMYHLLFALIAASIIGVIWAIKDKEKRSYIGALGAIYGFFWLGQLYYVVMLFMTKGASTSMGWYIYCVVAAEIVLFVVGIQRLIPEAFRLSAIAILIVLLGALDFYTVNFVSIPYYTGLTSHAAGSGSVGAFHFSALRGIGIGGIVERLCFMKPTWLTPAIQSFFYLNYLVATLFLIVLPFALLFERLRAQGRPCAPTN